MPDGSILGFVRTQAAMDSTRASAICPSTGHMMTSLRGAWRKPAAITCLTRDAPKHQVFRL